MEILTGDAALVMVRKSKRIPPNAFTQSPHLLEMMELPDGRVAEHHLEFGMVHKLLCCSIEEAAAKRAVPLSRNML
jgi:hypothetical protein